MGFARWTFRGAGIYGLLVLLPQYFLEERIGQDAPPAITHPEYFYGFAGIAIAWQVAFLIIGHDPQRYRTMMLPAVLEKFSFIGAVAPLYLGGRVAGPVVGFAAIDLVLGILFLVAYFRVGKAGVATHGTRGEINPS